MGSGEQRLRGKATEIKMGRIILTLTLLFASLFICMFLFIVWFILKTKKEPKKKSVDTCEAQKESLVSKNILNVGNESFIDIDGLFSDKTAITPDQLSTTSSSSSDSSLSLSNSSSEPELGSSTYILTNEEMEKSCSKMENSLIDPKNCINMITSTLQETKTFPMKFEPEHKNNLVAEEPEEMNKKEGNVEDEDVP